MDSRWLRARIATAGVVALLAGGAIVVALSDDVGRGVRVVGGPPAPEAVERVTGPPSFEISPDGRRMEIALERFMEAAGEIIDDDQYEPSSDDSGLDIVVSEHVSSGDFERLKQEADRLKVPYVLRTASSKYFEVDQLVDQL